MELLDTAIVDLECRLGLKPGEDIKAFLEAAANREGQKPKQTRKKTLAASGNMSNSKSASSTAKAPPPPPDDQPEICKLEFKVGVITKVWNHPEADKLYCEEIDCGEDEPRQIASGLRPYFTLEQMQGQRLLVVSNLKAKNLVRFKSHGMVLVRIFL